jgi:chromosome partitioning protein
MAEIISIASQKGGVGKTTTAINLAACLVEKGNKVLLIDLDPQGHIATSFKQEKYDIKGGVVEFILNHHEINNYIYASPMPHLDFIPSNIWSDNENKLEEFSQRDSLFLKMPLINIERLYDFIFIDCPPALDKLTHNALAASNSIIVPIQCEFYALKALSKLLKVVQEIKKSVNPGLKYKGFLLTMVDLRSNLQRLVYERIQYNLKGLIFEATIPRNIRLAEVPYRGEPVVLFDKNSKGAISYIKLADEILNQGKTIESTLSTTGYKLAENY